MMRAWSFLGRYAEDRNVVIEAETMEAAMEIASVEPYVRGIRYGHRPGGGLVPVELTQEEYEAWQAVSWG